MVFGQHTMNMTKNDGVILNKSPSVAIQNNTIRDGKGKILDDKIDTTCLCLEVES